MSILFAIVVFLFCIICFLFFFSARAELSHKACAPTSELEGGGEIVVPRELAHGNQSFAASAELSHKACAPTSELVGGGEIVVPRELAHGNQSFAASVSNETR